MPGCLAEPREGESRMETAEEEAVQQARLAFERESKRGSFSSRSCPGCGKQTLVRRRLPLLLRPLRLVKRHLRAYSCRTCKRRPVFWS